MPGLIDFHAVERHLIHRWHLWGEPVVFALKKRRRLAALGIAEARDLGCCAIDLEEGRADCPPACRPLIENYEAYLGKYAFRGIPDASDIPLRRGIPLVIDLAGYPDFAGYAEALKSHSKGSIRREIRNARRLGFYSGRFNRDAYALDRFAIETSKWLRSSGPVLAAFVRPQPDAIAPPRRRDEPPGPECAHHWVIDWGVFFDDGAAGRARLVGYAYLRRTGNIVRLHAMMGHGAYLGHSIMKLLLADVMRWLLSRDEPAVQGVRYLHGGALEHGGPGLVGWKHRAQFKPVLFDRHRGSEAATAEVPEAASPEPTAA